MALLTYARDPDNDTPVFAIVADDEGADYVWPEEAEPWFDEDRLTVLVKMTGQAEPTDAAGWMALASQSLGRGVVLDDPVEINDVDSALTDIEGQLEGVEPDDDAGFLASVSEAFDEISQDYPGFGDTAVEETEDENLSPEAMDNFVLMALGPIDPDGENGWILRAMDGQPLKGDEDEYVHVPGESNPPETESEEEE